MENKGQITDQTGNLRSDVLYVLRTKGASVAITRRGLSYQFANTNTENPGIVGIKIKDEYSTPRTDFYRMDVVFSDANEYSRPVPAGEPEYVENYFNIPGSPEGITGVKGYERITLEDVWPGIDWVVYTDDGFIKYDFVVHPGADPSRIAMEYKGAVSLSLQSDGTLLAVTPMGEIREAAPVCFSGDEEVETRFVLEGEQLSFQVGEYDKTRDLVIDPALMWATYYGGTGYDYALSVTTDYFGNVYLAGYTQSAANIASSGAHDEILNGTTDGFLAKFSPAGVRQWATYFGGSSVDYIYSVKVNNAGEPYVVGRTTSNTGVATAGSHDATYNGAGDAFIAKFKADGKLNWSTYYGGAADDLAYSLAVSADGLSLYVAGQTKSSAGISTSGAHDPTYSADFDAYLVKFDSAGIRQWGTYYGDTGKDEYDGVALDDATGYVYLSGCTNSGSGISTMNGPQGGVDAFLVSFDGAGTRLWGRYFGGSFDDFGWAIGVDANSNVYMTGRTASAGLGSGATHQTALAGGTDAFLARFTSAGAIDWSTYYGGAGNDEGFGVALDGTSGAYLTGQTASNAGINFNSSFQTSSGGGSDAMIARFNSGDGTIDWGSYYGGSAADIGYSVAPDGKGKVYFAGQLGSSIPMPFPGMQDTTYNGGFDAFLVKVDESSCPVFVSSPANVTVLSESICSGCTLSGGAFTSPSGTPCPYGSTLQYAVSTNGGFSYGIWSTTAPVYDQWSTLTIKTRCNCDFDGAISSEESVPVTTYPGICIPPVVSISGNLAITPGTSTTLTATGGVQYSWSSGETASVVTVAPQATTTYSVTATGANGCTTETSAVVTVLPFPVCRAKISPTEYKNFMCHNLGAANTSADPFTPSWEINGGYWQWGRKEQAVAGPSGPDASQANDVVPGSWNSVNAADDAWLSVSRTANDPCPSGFRVPSKSDWESLIVNNTVSNVGSWNNSPVNYSSGKLIGSDLMLPAAGGRHDENGGLLFRGSLGLYWSATTLNTGAWFLNLGNAGIAMDGSTWRTGALSVRCIEFEGQIDSLDCAAASVTGNLTAGTNSSGISVVVPYSGGNGGVHSGQTITSTGVTGLTATLNTGSFANGSGSLVYDITGTPSGSGTASFALNIGGQSCTLNLNVAQSVVCRAKVSPTEYKNFMCYNLGAANTNADPFTPSWEIIGGYWQWGRKAQAAAGPVGQDTSQQNDGPVSGWITATAPYDSWLDDVKTLEDPCPEGYRVPTYNQWSGILSSNTITDLGTWFGSYTSYTNYSSGKKIGAELMLPAAGWRNYIDGKLSGRGGSGHYINSSGGQLYFHSGFISADFFWNRNYGFSVRCIAEDGVQGQISTILCDEAAVSGEAIAHQSCNLIIEVPYTGGNGGFYSGQTIVSSGVNGMTATLYGYVFANGSGTLSYAVTGIPDGAGTANFILNIGGQVCTLSVAVNYPPGGPVCRAKVSATEYKYFMCHNLGAANSDADPFTPSWEINGGYWQWGRSAQAAEGPAGPDISQANSGLPGSWNNIYAPDGSWSDSVKTVNDPCPTGYRVPSNAQWDSVITNNMYASTGTWSESATNYSSGIKFGNQLLLPAAGYRYDGSVPLYYRGYHGYYWSSTDQGSLDAWYMLTQSNGVTMSSNNRISGLSIRCIAEVGLIGSIFCDSIDASGSLIVGKTAQDASVSIPYTGGNGGDYNKQVVSSTGVTGLTATLHEGILSVGSGILTLMITGTPGTAGIASFELNVGGQMCTINVAVVHPVCRAKVSPAEYKNFMCYNLGTANTNADPFSPSWEINGGYWQWGRKAQAAAGPSGPTADQANDGPVSGWNNSVPPDGALGDSAKTENDPCPSGFRVPTKSQWEAVLLNNSTHDLGSWDYSSTNYDSGKKIGDELVLPAAGIRFNIFNGGIASRGITGNYLCSTQHDWYYTWYLYFTNWSSGPPRAEYSDKHHGYSVRCIEDTAPVGTITAISCDNTTTSGTLLENQYATGVTAFVPYSGGNGGQHDGQAIESTGVTGLTATLSAGNFANGSGSLGYSISGVPAGNGTASFTLNIGGQSCTLDIPVGVFRILFNESSGKEANDGVVCSGDQLELSLSAIFADGTGPSGILWSTGETGASITVTPSVTQIYYVTATDANGNLFSTSAYVTVESLPSASIILLDNTEMVISDDIVCEGSGNTAIRAETPDPGAYSYLWNDGSEDRQLTISLVCDTWYQVTVTDSVGCQTVVSKEIFVEHEPRVSYYGPLSGTAGTQVYIQGEYLSGVTGVAFSGVPANYFISNDHQIVATLPFNGSIDYLNLTNRCSSLIIPAVAPLINYFTPGAGPVGTLVTVTGSNLNLVTGANLGGVAAPVIFQSPGMLVLEIMPGTPTGQLGLLAATGSSVTTSSFYVTETPYPVIQQGSKRTDQNSTSGAKQGTSVAVSANGNTAVIGAPSDNSDRGAVWVFTRTGSNWSSSGVKLVGTGEIGTARQGTSVAVSADGNTIAVGAPGDNDNRGAVWVFTREGGNWSQSGPKITGTGTSSGSRLGISVALSSDGNTLASGAIGYQSYGGAVWIFDRYDNNWIPSGGPIAGIDAIGQAMQGVSVALNADGSVLLSGGHQDDNRRGAVWMFTRADCNWYQYGTKLVGSGGSAQAWQGYSVSLSADGNTALVGGCLDNGLAGSAWVFRRSGSFFQQEGPKLSGSWMTGQSRFGSSVSLSADGNTAVIGGPGDNANKGAMWVFNRNTGEWLQKGGKLNGSGAVGAAMQGTSVSLGATGTTALLGGPADASGRGAFWVYSTNSLPSVQTALPIDERDKSSKDDTMLRLDQNIPNPLYSTTQAGFSLPEACSAEWEITDVNGRAVMILQREYPAGENVETFDLSGYSGVYWYTIKTPFGVRTRKMVVVPR